MKKHDSFCFCPLASGSAGNSLFVSCNEINILIDAGLSGIEIQRRLTKIGRNPENLSAIIITHEHNDHVKGAGILSRRFDIPVYMTQKTFLACKDLGKLESLYFFECGSSFQLYTEAKLKINITSFSISHDAIEPIGLTLEYNNHKLGMATDLGIATTLVKNHLKNCDVLYLESNHDIDMLINGSYPWYLKQRIKGRTGHLSNLDAKKLVAELSTDKLKHVILAHLSEENNSPQKALQEVSKGLKTSEIVLHVASPDKPGKLINLMSGVF